MPRKVKAIVLTGNGTNCEMEMAHACKLAGADMVDIVHISELLFGEKKLSGYHFLNLPGGFLDGDDLGSAKAGANRFLHAPISGADEMLIEELLKFINAGGLILGVCNGFQLMVKLGLLPLLTTISRNRARPLHSMIQGDLKTAGCISRPTQRVPACSPEILILCIILCVTAKGSLL